MWLTHIFFIRNGGHSILSALGLEHRWLQFIYILDLKWRWSWIGVSYVFNSKWKSLQIIRAWLDIWMFLVHLHFGLGMPMTLVEHDFFVDLECKWFEMARVFLKIWSALAALSFGLEMWMPQLIYIWMVSIKHHYFINLKRRWSQETCIFLKYESL